MKPLIEIQRIRYPPFEPSRWNPSQLPIATRTVELGFFENEEAAQVALQSSGPAFRLGTHDQWLIERTYSYDGECLPRQNKAPVLETNDFVDVVYRQRRGWYLVPNPIHNMIRRFINGVVLILLAALFYLFISPVLLFLDLPVYGLETVRWGLLDYPALAVVVVPLIFAPLFVRVLANLIELRRQNQFLASHPSKPSLEFLTELQANRPLEVMLHLPDQDPSWNHVDVFWRVGVLPPAREVLLAELNRTPARQPPPGLSTELPHHWIEGLDDGTAGGEDAPMELQEVKGGLYLRPMRIMALGEQKRWTEGEALTLEAPEGTWPGSVHSDMIRVHWECIVRIDRQRGGPLLWVEPLRVAHPAIDVMLDSLPVHDGRSESDIT